MKNLWDSQQAERYASDPLQMRVYTSRLLGQEEALVLHSGGNTSVKVRTTNVFGDAEDIIFVKGSGWDLATIEAAGFAPVRIDTLRRLAELDQLSDAEMVRLQRSAMTDPGAPTPSVEAILHAVIPFAYVDHTHADAVVLITNTDKGEERIRDIYGDRVLIVPYVMPGFELAKHIYEMTREIDWQKIEGLILMNHGVFTFADDARTSYNRMVDLVTEAEEHIANHAKIGIPPAQESPDDLLSVAQLRRAVSMAAGYALLASLDTSPLANGFSSLPDVASVATRGPLTPDHVIRTKRIPLVIGHNPGDDIDRYVGLYRAYFQRNTNGRLAMVDPAPRWAVWQRTGIVAFGRTTKDARIVGDIARHTIASIIAAEALGGWMPLSEKEIFDVEYWELEQAKLKKAGAAPVLSGKVAIVTGAAGGIGLACTKRLLEQGAVVVGLDIDESIKELVEDKTFRGHTCDVTDAGAVAGVVARTVREFGGLDIVVSNAGVFPGSATIAETDHEQWQKTMAVNLTSHQQLLKTCVPYLELGVDPAVVVVGSKNVPAPGKGQASYSVSKAGVTQLARVAALELGPMGIRVNVVHPNNVFDTNLWSQSVIEERARHYGMTAEEYKRNNVLGTEVESNDVAAMVCAMVGPLFAKTTGAQVPVDGGNDRVI